MSGLLRQIYQAFAKATFHHNLGKIRRGMVQAEATLMDLIQSGKNTEYGRLYHFSSIQNAQDYRAKVPLVAYKDLAPFIQRAHQGQEQVLTAEDPVYFAKSSGTTGSQKLVPMTARSLKGTNMAMMLDQEGSLGALLPRRPFPGRSLMMIAMGKEEGAHSGSATAGGMEKMAGVIPLFWVTPAPALRVADQETALYLHLFYSLQEKKLDMIAAPFGSNLLQLFRILECHKETLIGDIAWGTLSPPLDLEEDIRQLLVSDLRPNPSRAMEVQALLNQGMEGVIPKIWPRMRCLNTVIGGDFTIYEDLLRCYAGRIPIFSSIYGSSEGQIGIGVSLEEPIYLLSTHVTYFEFIPEEDLFDPTPRVLLMDQVEIGSSYELVMTTPSGFYRYRLGDVVKVVAFEGGTPLVAYRYRTGILLNAVGEKTSSDALWTGLDKASKASGSRVLEYTTSLDLAGPTPVYQVLVAATAPIKACDLDIALGMANPRYLAAREAGKLGLCQIEMVSLASFEFYKNQRLAGGTSASQFKMPRTLTGPEADLVREARS